MCETNQTTTFTVCHFSFLVSSREEQKDKINNKVCNYFVASFIIRYSALCLQNEFIIFYFKINTIRKSASKQQRNNKRRNGKKTLSRAVFFFFFYNLEGNGAIDSLCTCTASATYERGLIREIIMRDYTSSKTGRCHLDPRLNLL